MSLASVFGESSFCSCHENARIYFLKYCTITSAWYRTPEILLSTSQTTRLFHSSVFELLWVVALQNANRDGALCIHKMQHRNRQWYRFQSLMLTGTTGVLGVHRIVHAYTSTCPRKQRSTTGRLHPPTRSLFFYFWGIIWTCTITGSLPLGIYRPAES